MYLYIATALILTLRCKSLSYVQKNTKSIRTHLYSSLFERFNEKFLTPKRPKEEVKKSEDDVMLDYLVERPWRANKIKNLNVTYRYENAYPDVYKSDYIIIFLVEGHGVKTGERDLKLKMMIQYTCIVCQNGDFQTRKPVLMSYGYFHGCGQK